jgi:transcriptional regulator with XRE-family HTH domain
MTQSELASALRITPQAISQWERDETFPEFGKIARIARALKTTADVLILGDLNKRDLPETIKQVAELANLVEAAGRACGLYPSANQDATPAAKSPLRRPNPKEEPGALRPPDVEAPTARMRPHAQIIGWVGAGSEAHFYDLKAAYLDTISAPEPRASVAVEIRGPSLGDMFDRWYAFYEDGQEPVGEKHFGRLCVVHLADGRTLLRKVLPGRGNGCTLTSDTEEPIENARVIWAACVTHMVPRWATRLPQT